MNEITTGPELEACGWYVRTKRTDVDSAGWLVADCSTIPHGKEYARLFAASPKLLAALSGLYELVSTLSVPDEQYLRVTKAAAAIALATQAPEDAPVPVWHITTAGVDR